MKDTHKKSVNCLVTAFCCSENVNVECCSLITTLHYTVLYTDIAIIAALHKAIKQNKKII